MKAGYTIYYGFNFGFTNIVCVNIQSSNKVEFYNRTDPDVDKMTNQHYCIAIFRIKKYHNTETKPDA